MHRNKNKGRAWRVERIITKTRRRREESIFEDVTVGTYGSREIFQQREEDGVAGRSEEWSYTVAMH
jgi:hypothetical protein